MKIRPDLLAAIALGGMVATFSNCDSSSGTADNVLPENDTLTVAITDSVPGQDSLGLPGCGAGLTDSLKSGTISDGDYECPACGMG